jgi:hypothetical protein
LQIVGDNWNQWCCHHSNCEYLYANGVFIPQDIPLHVTMLSFLLIAVDRYRLMLDPTKPRMPSFVCALGTWLLAVCIVLPYPIYITYLDLGVSSR